MGKPLFAFAFLLFSALPLAAQELPPDELQVNLNGYFDNFRVNIVYPSVSLTKQVTETTSITGRYLVDVISAASMKSQFSVDGVTSASVRRGEDEGETEGIDEVRHETGLGVTQLIGKATLSLNGLYSTEHDYTSRTLAAQLSYPFARKNTTLQLGVVRTWDRVFPDTQSWTRRKDVVSLSAGLTQVLGKRLIAQFDASYTTNEGYLADPYQVVRILEGETFGSYFNQHPDTRTRRAVGLRLNYMVARDRVLQLGYRYYWDSWEVRSHTVNTVYQRRVREGFRLRLGLRAYSQSQAFFFAPRYTTPQPFMTVDNKLDQGVSGEVQLKLLFEKAALRKIPLLGALVSDGTGVSTSFSWYTRHTRTADWHSRYRTLHAYVFSIGYRYQF